MKPLNELVSELDCLTDCLTLLSNVTGDDYKEGCGEPARHVVQDAIYSIAQHLERITLDIDAIDSGNARKGART